MCRAAWHPGGRDEKRNVAVQVSDGLLKSGRTVCLYRVKAGRAAEVSSALQGSAERANVLVLILRALGLSCHSFSSCNQTHTHTHSSLTVLCLIAAFARTF